MFFHFLIGFRTCLFGDCFNKFAQQGEVERGLGYLTRNAFFSVWVLVFNLGVQSFQFSAKSLPKITYPGHTLGGLIGGQGSAPE